MVVPVAVVEDCKRKLLEIRCQPPKRPSVAEAGASVWCFAGSGLYCVEVVEAVVALGSECMRAEPA